MSGDENLLKEDWYIIETDKRKMKENRINKFLKLALHKTKADSDWLDM